MMSTQLDGLSPREVVDSFPEEAKEIAPKELKRWKRALRAYIRKKINPLLREVSPKNRPIVQKILIARWPHWEVIQKLAHRIKHLERIIVVLRGKERGRQPLLIDEARRYPLDRLCEEEGIELKGSGRNLRGLCPLHDDRNPSFTVFSDGKWRCFGCGESGDGIDLIMKLKNLNFVEAVKYLTGGS